MECNSQNEALLEQLRNAADGLLWMSESDYPFEPFVWEDMPELNPQAILEKTNHSPDTPVETRSLDDFFRVAIQEQDWHNDEEKALVQRYQSLVALLKQTLRDIQVYRVGQIEIDVYIVGIAPSGNPAGLATKVIET